MKILVYIDLKNWVTATGFIIAIAYLNFLIEYKLLSSSYISAKINIKKLQKLDKFKVIYIVDILFLIINNLI